MVDAGVGDQDVEPAMAGGDRVDARARARLVGDVERLDVDGEPARAQRRTLLVERLRDRGR